MTNQPINQIDPDGHCSIAVLGISIIISAGACPWDKRTELGNDIVFNSGTEPSNDFVFRVDTPKWDGPDVVRLDDPDPYNGDDVLRQNSLLADMSTGYSRKKYGGSQTTNNPEANRLRDAGLGLACPTCGATMKSGTKTAPSPQHEPSLVEHWWEYGGKGMTDEERKNYAKSAGAYNGVQCLSCQHKEGGILSGYSKKKNLLSNDGST